MNDDIYGDLENYNDVNELDELRNENRELKLKLKIHASSMDRLQKDFDTLSAEYKKLEVNYSSLLKTARSEIERKTEIIKTLNIEKDAIILKSLQKSNENILKIRRNLREAVINCTDKNNKSKGSDTGKCDSEKERMASIETTSSGNTDLRNKLSTSKAVEKQTSKADTYNKHSDSKENISKTWAQSIRNRRKSMPVTSLQSAKFSSDEELEENYSTEESNIKKDWFLKQDKSRRGPERPYWGKKKHKASETSGIDDKYSSYQESSRETFYKSGKYNDKHRIPKKHDPPSRHRKFSSPERSLRRPHKGHYNEQYKEPEIRKYRLLESPPVEKYGSYSRNRSRDRRSNYDREHVEDRPRSRQEKQRMSRHEKHRLSSERDEPASKRMKTSSSSACIEDKRMSPEPQCIPEPVLTKTRQQMEWGTCQSPDFSHSENEVLEFERVREIMPLSAGPQDDPRLNSPYYETRSENERVVLCAVSGKNVNLEKINISIWHHNSEMPKARQRPPPQPQPEYTDDMVQQLYSGITTDPESNTYVDREILSEVSSDKGEVGVTDEYSDHNISRKLNTNTREDIVETSQQKECIATKEVSPKATKYKIPKKTDNDQVVQIVSQTPLIKLFNEFNIPTEVHEIRHTDKLDVDKLYTPEKKDNKSESSKRQSEHFIEYKDQKKWLEMVEGDLELSDETCDNSDTIKKDTKENHEKMLDNNANRSSRDEKTRSTKHYEPTSRHTIENKVYSSELLQEDKTKDVSPAQKLSDNSPVMDTDISIPETSKTKKSKRKSQKQEDSKETSISLEIQTEKNSKPKKESKQKDINETFISPQIQTGKKPKPKNDSKLKDIKETSISPEIQTDRKTKPIKDSRQKEIKETSISPEIQTEKNTKPKKDLKQKDFKETLMSSGIETEKRTKPKKDSKLKDPKETSILPEIGTERKTKTNRDSKQKDVKEMPISTEIKTERKTKPNKDTKKKDPKETSIPPEIEMEKKTKLNKDSKQKDIKEKYSALFGDSSSLITPEDLGANVVPHNSACNQNIPFFEDAQDAVDINVQQIAHVQAKSAMEGIDMPFEKVRTEQYISQEIKPGDGKIPSNETKEETRNSANPNLFVNVDTGVSEQNVVNTVIISTGVQPQLLSDAPNTLGKAVVAEKVNESSAKNVTIPMALATSTPYKGLVHLQQEIPKVPESGCSTSDGKVVKKNESTLDESSQSTETDVNNGDVPDIRIFVKRRRKIAKKVG